MLLGAPLIEGSAMNLALENRCLELERAAARLKLISAHDALVILKNSLSAPKLLHTLRSSPCTGHHLLERFDNALRASLVQITNTELDDFRWIQAGLPVGSGGLGVRSVALLAPSAFLASAAATLELQSELLPVGFDSVDRYVSQTLETWHARQDAAEPLGVARAEQLEWDRASIEPLHQARLLASQVKNSGAWINAWPITSCGLRLDNEAIRIAVGLRLGSKLCEPHVCPCGALVDSNGIHGLACRRSLGRITRHNLINDQIHRALLRAKIPAAKEPAGLVRNDGFKWQTSRWHNPYPVAERKVLDLGRNCSRHDGCISLTRHFKN